MTDNTPITVETCPDGAIRCYNDTDYAITLRLWGMGTEVVVSPKSEFRGNPVHSHRMLISRKGKKK